MTTDEPHSVMGSFGAALARLADALRQPKTEWTRDASIQRFEFSFELAWKAISRFARDEGLEAPSPKQALRTAFRFGWIEEDPGWLRMLDDRNRTTHTYHEATAEEIYARLPEHLGRMERLAARLGTLL